MQKHERTLLFFIFIIVVTAVIETDIYLPSFANMITYFSVSETDIQKLLTWNFIGVCIVSPLYGPISDSWGRKKPLIATLVLFLIGSLITVFATQFDTMLFGRVLQGLGSGGCITLGTTVLFDVFQKEKAVKALNQLNFIVTLVLGCAPLIGGYLNYLYGFRSNFVLIALLVTCSLTACIFFFRETLPIEKQTIFHPKKFAFNLKVLLTSSPFWLLIFITSFIFACYITFLSQIAILYTHEFGVSQLMFPIHQSVILIGYLIGCLTCPWIVQKFGRQKTKILGTVCLIFSTLLFAGVSIFTPQEAVWITLSMVPFSLGFAWSQSLYYTELIEAYPWIKGLVTSLSVSIKLLITAIIVSIAGHLYNETIYPVVAIFIIFTTLTAILSYVYETLNPLPKGSTHSQL